jgi:TRAP-type C4-dicarboxylate transport system permease small subunit
LNLIVHRGARLAVLAAVLGAFCAEAATEGTWGAVQAPLRWVILSLLVGGLLVLPKQAARVLATNIIRLFGDLRSVFAGLNRPWRWIERTVVVLAAIGMTVLVFLELWHRNLTGRIGDTGTNWLGLIVHPDPASPNSEAVVPLLMLWAGVGVFMAFAVDRALSRRLGSRPLRMFIGVLGGAAIFGASRWFVTLAPNNVPGAKTLALGCLLYLAFFGAAIAAEERKHIGVDAIRKNVPEALKPLFAFLGGLGGAAFCLFLAWLGALQVSADYSAWAANPAVKIYESVPVPYWTVRIAIPIGLAVAALRFAGQAFDDLWFGPPETEDALASAGVAVDREALEAAIRDAEAQEARV